MQSHPSLRRTLHLLAQSVLFAALLLPAPPLPAATDSTEEPFRYGRAARTGKRPAWAEPEEETAPEKKAAPRADDDVDPVPFSPRPGPLLRRPARQSVAPAWSPEAAAWLAEVEALARNGDATDGLRLTRLRQSAIEAVAKAQSPDVLLAVSDVMSVLAHDAEGLRDYRAVSRVQEALVDSPLLAKLSPRERAVVLHNAAVLLGPSDVFEGDHTPARSRMLGRQALELFRALPAETPGQLAALQLQVLVDVLAADSAAACTAAAELMQLARGPAADTLLENETPSPYVTLVGLPGEGPTTRTAVFVSKLRPEEDSDDKLDPSVFLERFRNDTERWQRLERAAARLVKGLGGPAKKPNPLGALGAIPGVDAGKLAMQMESMQQQMEAKMTAAMNAAGMNRTGGGKKAKALVKLAMSLPLDPVALLDADTLAAASAEDPMTAMLRAAGRDSTMTLHQGRQQMAENFSAMSPVVDEPLLWGYLDAETIAEIQGAVPERPADAVRPFDAAARWRRWVANSVAGDNKEAREDYQQCRAEMRAAEDALVAAVFAAEQEFRNAPDPTDEMIARRIAADPAVREAAKAVPVARERLAVALKPMFGVYLAGDRRDADVFSPNTLLVGLPFEPYVTVVWVARVGPDGNPGSFVARRAGEHTLPVALVKALATDGAASVAQLRDHGAELFANLFPADIGQAIAAADNIVFIAPGDWADFPFGLLRYATAEGQRYLGETKNWAVTESVWLLADNRRARKPAAEGVFAGGITQFKTAIAASSRAASLRHLGALPQATAEASRVAQVFGVAPKLGAEVTEAGVVEALRDRRLVHLATHGLSDPFEGAGLAERTGMVLSFARSTGFPGLVLQPVKGGKDHNTDGFLQAWELVTAGPFRADIVVLSACDSGRRYSQLTAFPELPRVLLDGGVRAVQAARWKVDDAATDVFMQNFHQALSGGKSAAEANRAAVRALLADSRFSHPRFWAAFGIFGDPAARVK